MITPATLRSAPVQKLLVIGDSITKHGPSVENLGWSGNWGMAASSEDKDYVHLFLARLTQEQGGKAPELYIHAEGGGTLLGKAGTTDKFRAFGADLAIIQMGENDKDLSDAGFKTPYETIIKEIKAGNPNVRIICFSTWAPPNCNPIKDGIILDLCKQYGLTYAYLGSAVKNPDNMAKSENRFTHAGVNWHPGDKGMQAYADVLWQAYTKPEDVQKITSPTATASPKRTEVLFTERWDGKSGLSWNPSANVEQVNGKSALKTVAEKAGFNTIVAPISVEKIKGHTLVIKTRVKADNLSAKPNAWEGIKVMVPLQNAEAKIDYPQFDLPVGTFDWTPVNLEVHIPDNIVKADLVLGLEHVTGTVWIDEVEISVKP